LVPESDTQDLLRDLVARLGVPVVVHCCAPHPPLALLVGAGVAGIGIDATLPEISGDTAVPAALDAVGEVWDAGVPLLLGLVPALPPRRRAPEGTPEEADAAPPPALRALARRAFDLADRLGFDRARLADLAVPTPTCGLAGATPDWARTAMSLSRQLGEAFVDPPESWWPAR
jgi:hypothetical protein